MKILINIKSSENTFPYAPQNINITIPLLKTNGDTLDLIFVLRGYVIEATIDHSDDYYGRVHSVTQVIEDFLNGYWLKNDVVGFLSAEYFSFNDKTYLLQGSCGPLVELRKIGDPLLVDDSYFTIFNSEFGPTLTGSIRSYKKALSDSSDGPMHIYRSIEIIRQYFKERLPEEIKKDDLDLKSWESLRKTLSLTKEQIQEFAKYMVPNRHGVYFEFTKEQFRAMLKLSHLVINRFIIYAKSNMPN